MSTHAGALLLAAPAYRFARRYAQDPRFTFGTGKLGDLAGFTSAIVLAMIAVLIGYEAVHRFFAPVPIRFAEAIPIAALGLVVNLASFWLLKDGHGHHHSHAHGSAATPIPTADGTLALEIFETGHPPVFRLRALAGRLPPAGQVAVETLRPDGTRQGFALAEHGGFLQGTEPIPEPHDFTATLRVGAATHAVVFAETAHGHDAAHRDNNLRAAVVHVLADAAVSVLVIAGLVLARIFGWLFMDPLAGIAGSVVIASWSYGLIRDTGAILLDMNPDPALAASIRRLVQTEGDELADLHLWRLGPGHLGAIVSVVTRRDHGVSITALGSGSSLPCRT